MSPEDQQMSLIEHLTELRYRLVKILQGIVVGGALGVYYAEELMKVIRAPIIPYFKEGEGLTILGIMDRFMLHIKVGLLAGVILSCPYWLYHIWKFIAPGLYEKERKYAAGFIISGSLLFLTGVVFVYMFVFPQAFEFLMRMGGDDYKNMINVNEYIGFFLLCVVAFGVAFELPVVLVLMALMGLIDAEFLKKQRRYAIVILAIAAALLTPPDIISMTMMLVPLYVLYECSIWIIQFLIGKRTAPY